MHRQELFGCRQNKTGGKRSALLFIRVCVCAFYGAKAFFFFFCSISIFGCRAVLIF